MLIDISEWFHVIRELSCHDKEERYQFTIWVIEFTEGWWIFKKTRDILWFVDKELAQKEMKWYEKNWLKGTFRLRPCFVELNKDKIA